MTPEQSYIQFCCTIYGCVICRRPGVVTPDGVFSYGEYHHLLHAGKRIGPMDGFGLCSTHHRFGGSGHIARGTNQKKFERAYGTEADMLAEVKAAYDKFCQDKVLP